MTGIVGSGGIIRPTRGIVRRGGIIAAPDQIVKTYDLTSALPAGATFSRASIGTRYNASGVLVTETSDVPRFDHDPVTLAPLGLLIEGARTNFFQRSEQLDNAYWTIIAGTITADNAISPDGTQDAERLMETSASSVHLIFRNGVTITTGPRACMVRIFAKPNGRDWIKVRVDDGGTGNIVWANFNVTTGAKGLSAVGAGTWTIQDYRISPAGNGWYCCELLFTTLVLQTLIRPIFYFMRSDVNAVDETYVGDVTKGMFLWGFDVGDAGELGTYIPTTSASVTRAADSLTLPIPDGVWDITTTDTTGSTTTRRAVAGGYVVTPRSGKTRVTSIRAVQIASYAGFDSDALAFIAANNLIDPVGDRALDATFKAIKANATLTFADIAFAGLAPGRNLDTGTTVKVAGGWTAARIDGTLSSSARMRTGDPYGLYTNNGETGSTITRIDFPSVPLGTTYAVLAIAAPKGDAAVGRAIYSVGGNTAAMQQIGSQVANLASQSNTRNFRSGRANLFAHIQEASSVGRSVGELGHEATTTLNVTGTQTVYLGAQFIAGASGNTEVGGDTAIVLEAVAWMKNPSVAKVRALGEILKNNLCVPVSQTVEGFITTGQSQASSLFQMMDRVIAADATYGRSFLHQWYQHINQPISEWVGNAAPFTRSNFYNAELLPSGGLWQTLLGYETRPARTSGLFWFQGEADFGYAQGLSNAAAEARAAAYQAKLQAFVDFIRADYPGLPIVIFQVDWENTVGYTLTASNILCRDTVRAAQAAVAAANPKITLIDTRGYARDPADGIHITSAGIASLIPVAWNAMKALL